MNQREMFSRGKDLKLARSTWNNSILEETIVKVLMDGLTACRIPVFRVRERISSCPKCHQFVGRPSEAGIPDLVGWIPPGVRNRAIMYAPALNEVTTGDYSSALPLFIEVKRPKGGVESAVQREFLARARAGGAIAFFARGWDECVAELKAAGVKIPEGI